MDCSSTLIRRERPKALAVARRIPKTKANGMEKRERMPGHQHVQLDPAPRGPLHALQAALGLGCLPLLMIGIDSGGL
jgi:hypothetical protein